MIFIKIQYIKNLKLNLKKNNGVKKLRYLMIYKKYY